MPSTSMVSPSNLTPAPSKPLRAAAISPTPKTGTALPGEASGQSLAHLVNLDLLERNPGQGHPLRPEFRLTAEGEQAATIAAAVFKAAPHPTDRALLRRRWTLPVLAVLPTPRPFGALKRDLPPITDRALSQSLKSLENHRWLKRRIEPDSRPPRALYRATGTAERIGTAFRMPFL